MKKTKITIFFAIISLGFFGSLGIANAAPLVTGVSGTIADGSSVAITGNGFGVKNIAIPKFFNTMEDVPLGALPDGFTVNSGPVGTPVALSPSRGMSSKAMKFFADLTAIAGGSESWNRSVYDLGTGGADHVYISFWLYLDKTGTLCTASPVNNCQWQWKNTRLGSFPHAYTSTDTTNTNVAANAWIKDTGFFNVFEQVYYNGLTWGASSNPSAPSDMFLFNQWQRVNYYFQRSSLPLTADGQFKVQRIGRAMILNEIAAITHDSDDLPWRYIGMGQAITNVNETYVGTGGRVVWTAYYDDVYIDTTQTRLELCDTAVWNAVGHCEIQIPSAWSDTSATITLNQGSFTDFNNAYLYVVDANGNVNTNGYPLTISDTTPPSIPSNLTAAAVSSSQINLSWTASTDNVGVAGYKIFRCAGSGCIPIIQIATSTTASYSNISLVASTVYSYAVSAYDAAGNESIQSTPISITTLPLKGDFNSDSKVNDLDFTSFKNAFKSIFNSIFDLNSDSAIDVKDLGVLMSGWLP